MANRIPAPQRSASRHRDRPPENRAGASVLIVDADDDVRWKLATHVRDRGHLVATAADGVHALNLLHAQHFDIIFADLHIADEAGWPLLHAIRRQRPRSTVVLMSTHGSGDDAVRAIHAGAYYVLGKPLLLDHVGRVLDDILGVGPPGRRSRIS